MSWERLIRFQDESGQQRFGEPIIKDADELESLLAKGGLFANEFKGSDPFALEATGQKKKVVKLLGILEPTDVPIVKCVGLNYMKHIQEAGRKPPPFPSIFVKPRTSIASHEEDIPIPKLAQDEQCDYEGELSIVIGKTGKNIAKADVLDHIAGYVTSNDVSARKWQRDPAYAGGVPQFCFSKGFDKYAPVGPMIVSPKVVGNASGLRLQTLVNGETRQDTQTDDLIFNVEEIVAFISQGSTLEKGTVIMTGTPSGVAMGMQPPQYLKHGDLVEVKIEHLGSVKNKIVFE